MPNITVGNSEKIDDIHGGLWYTKGPGATSQLYIAIPITVLKEQIRAHEEDKASGTKLYFYSPPMERFEMNRMIRALRAARNLIFGGDE